MQQVVITGLGALCGLGRNTHEVWARLLAGKSGISRLSLCDPEGLPVQIAGEVKDYQISEHLLPPPEAARYDRFLHFALDAGTAAFRHAGLEGHYPPDRMGVILGVGMGGFKMIEDNYHILHSKGGKRVSPFFIPGIVSSMASGLLSIKLGMEGINYTVASACASGGHALAQACNEIQLGRQDVVISGGVESTLSTLPVFGFANMRALSRRNHEPERASRPFDRERDGFVMGEGAGMLVLENAQKARERGATIYGELLSWAANSDAHHITAPHPEGKGAVRCMQQALAAGGIEPQDVGYINAHGTSTPLGDIAETRAIKKVFGSGAKDLAISSTKSMTGHLLGAAGGIESVFCVMALATGEIPPTTNLDSPDGECDLDYVPHRSIKRNIRYALNNSFGFGGTNISIVFKREEL